MILKTVIVLLFIFCLPGSSHSGISFDKNNNVIRVSDFPEQVPCTLNWVYSLDKAYQWEKVTYDQTTDTYTVNCDLWIGDNDGTDTYFQIGTTEHPEQKLIMRGNIFICPYWIQEESTEKRWWVAPKKINRLTLGKPNDSAMETILKFDCNEKQSFTIYSAVYPARSIRGCGGQLHAYNAFIGTTGKGGKIASSVRNIGMFLRGDSIIWDHVRISDVSGIVTYGFSENKDKMVYTEFSNCEFALSGSKLNIANCLFQNCDVAVLDYGGLDAVLTGCVFRNNKHNWSLTFSDCALVCVDCEFGKPREGNIYRYWTNPKTGKAQYPAFVSKRHVIIEVVDENGDPLKNAKLAVKCEQKNLEAVSDGQQLTDEMGRTPGKGSKNALLLTEIIKTATDVINQPEVKKFSYSIDVTADGYQKYSRSGVCPSKSLDTIKIILKK